MLVTSCFFLAAFKFSLCFGFQQFDYNMSCGSFLTVSYLEFIELLGGIYACLSSDLGSFWPLFLQILLMCLSFFLLYLRLL